MRFTQKHLTALKITEHMLEVTLGNRVRVKHFDIIEEPRWLAFPSSDEGVRQLVLEGIAVNDMLKDPVKFTAKVETATTTMDARLFLGKGSEAIKPILRATKFVYRTREDELELLKKPVWIRQFAYLAMVYKLEKQGLPVEPKITEIYEDRQHPDFGVGYRVMGPGLVNIYLDQLPLVSFEKPGQSTRIKFGQDGAIERSWGHVAVFGVQHDAERWVHDLTERAKA